MMLFQDIPGLYLACKEDYAFAHLAPASANCTFPMSVDVNWTTIPEECQPVSMLGDYHDAGGLHDGSKGILKVETVRLFVMHNLPGRGFDEGDNPTSFVSSLHRADISNSTAEETLEWYVDSTQLFMAENNEDPTKIEFRQTWDNSQNISAGAGCVGHWKFYPLGDHWYDVQGFGLAHFFDFHEADAGFGRIDMIRVEEVPNTLAEVHAMCSKRRTANSSNKEQAKNVTNLDNETETTTMDAGNVEDTIPVDGDLSGSGRKLTTVAARFVSAALRVFGI